MPNLSGFGNDVPEDLRTLASLIKAYGRSRIAGEVASAVLATSVQVDKISTWLAAGAGAAGVLLFSQLPEVSAFFGRGVLRGAIIALVVIVLFGVLERVAAMTSQLDRAIEKEMGPGLAKALDDHVRAAQDIVQQARRAGVEVDVWLKNPEIWNDISEAVPWHLGYLLDWARQGQRDPARENYRPSLKLYKLQWLCLAVQLVSIIALGVSLIAGFPST